MSSGIILNGGTKKLADYNVLVVTDSTPKSGKTSNGLDTKGLKSKDSNKTDRVIQLPSTKIIRAVSPLLSLIVYFNIGTIISLFISNSNNPNDPTVIEEERDHPRLVEENDGMAKELEFETAIGKCRYTGPIDESNRPHGNGTAVFDDGRYYSGGFEHGTLSSKDVYFKYPNGDVFEGEFRENSFYDGTYTIADDGSYFVGTYKNGQPSKGTWYNKNGRIIVKI